MAKKVKKSTPNPLPKYVWANGLGITLECWFNKPRKYELVFRQEENIYVPTGDKKSSSLDGGFSILALRKRFDKISTEADCVVFLSEDKKAVEDFTKNAKKVLKQINDDGTQMSIICRYIIKRIEYFLSRSKE